MNLAPIALFVYNRPWHTQQTVEALQHFVQGDTLFVVLSKVKYLALI